MVAHNPLHRSGRAVFPHPALALGDNAHATQGIRMVGANEWQPAVDQPPHPVPKDASVLATPRKGAMPEPPHSEPEEGERRAVHGHSDRKSTRLNSSHLVISYAVFCLKKKNTY